MDDNGDLLDNGGLLDNSVLLSENYFCFSSSVGSRHDQCVDRISVCANYYNNNTLLYIDVSLLQKK